MHFEKKDQTGDSDSQIKRVAKVQSKNAQSIFDARRLQSILDLQFPNIGIEIPSQLVH